MKTNIEMPIAALEDAERDTAENAAAEKVVAEKETTVEVKTGNIAAKNVASSSSCGIQQSASAETCWNCDREFTRNHQCDSFPASEVRASTALDSVGVQAKLPCWRCDQMFPVDSQGYIPEHPCAESPPVYPPSV